MSGHCVLEQIAGRLRAHDTSRPDADHKSRVRQPAPSRRPHSTSIRESVARKSGDGVAYPVEIGSNITIAFKRLTHDAPLPPKYPTPDTALA